jgi:nicotinamide-nucleotide amidase
MRLSGLVAQAALTSGKRLTTAESCTGGWIAKCLTDVPGSSAWFEGGVVSYSNAAKTALLGIPGGLIEAQGAVSQSVVEAMARGVLSQGDADLAVAVSGVAGPGGGSADKPVGTVWLAWATATECGSERRQFSGNREDVRRETVAAALQALLASLQSA